MFDIYHDVYIQSSAEKVYNAISNPPELVNWWPLKCTGKASVGEEYNFFFEEPYDWYGEVTKAVPGRSFHVKMKKSDPDWEQTTFGFDLEKEENGVWLQFSHQNWPTRNRHFRHSSHCWAILLQGLKEYIEKGKIIPFEQRS